MKLYNYANDYALSERLSVSQKKLDPIKEVQDVTNGNTQPEAPVGTEGEEPETKADNQSAKAKKASSPALPHGEKSERERLQAVLKENRLSPAGLALWLYCDTGLQYTEIASLTWEQVDLEHHLLHLADRDEPLSAELVSLLCEVLETRGPVSETHVLLSPHARKPIPRARLSNLTKELLAKNGLDPALQARLR